MALHGDVEINGLRLMHWSARRIDELEAGREVYEYEVVAIQFVCSNIPVRRFDTTLEHRYDDGAALLASKVLAWAGELTKP